MKKTDDDLTQVVPMVAADERQVQNLRALLQARPRQEQAVLVMPPPGVEGEPLLSRLSATAEVSPSYYPYGAGLLADNEVGGRIPVASLQYWTSAKSLPRDYDARLAYPQCRTMRAVQNQGACGGCYAFAPAASLGDRICQATNGSTDAILSAEAPIFCPTAAGDYLGGCRGGNLGPVWEYLSNLGVPSGCSPGQIMQPSGMGPNQSSGLVPQSAASWAAQAAATPGGCCYPTARRTMESNNPTCEQEPCPGGSCPLRQWNQTTKQGNPGLGTCVDFWGNRTSNMSLHWRHYRARTNSTHGFGNNSEIMRAIFTDGPISTAIWLCVGDDKPAANYVRPLFPLHAYDFISLTNLIHLACCVHRAVRVNVVASTTIHRRAISVAPWLNTMEASTTAQAGVVLCHSML